MNRVGRVSQERLAGGQRQERLQLGQAAQDDRGCLAGALGRRHRGIRHEGDHHPGGATGQDAVERVLDNQAIGGLDTEALGGATTTLMSSPVGGGLGEGPADT